jgi:hypothetical protein
MEDSEVKSFSSEASYGVRTKSVEEAHTYVDEIAEKAMQNMFRAGFSARRIQVRLAGRLSSSRVYARTHADVSPYRCRLKSIAPKWKEVPSMAAPLEN